MLCGHAVDGTALHPVCYETSVTEGAIIGITRNSLCLRGKDAARRFYSDVLGIPEVPKPVPQAKRGGVWFETSAIRIHLGIEQDFRPAKKAHPGLLVRDLHSLSKRLTAAGYEVSGGEGVGRLRADLRQRSVRQSARIVAVP